MSRAIFVLAALLVAFALKWHTRHAPPQDIDWLLEPTVCLVQCISGRKFVAEQGIGYIDRDLGFIIAPECAGLNFLIAAFLTCVIGFASRSSNVRSRVVLLVASAAIAFPVTLGTNTIRILVAIALHRHLVTLPWCSSADLHRIDGIVVFFGALCLLHLTLKGLGAGRFCRQGRSSLRALRLRGVGATWSSLRVPLACYWGLTVVGPLLHGAAGSPGFWRHATFVVLLSLLTAGVIGLVGANVLPRFRGCWTRQARPVPARRARK